MYKMMGADGKEYGPVSVEQLRQWIAEGRANAQTRVQLEGSTEWRTVRELPEFADAAGHVPTAVPPPSGATPAEVTARDYHIDIGACLSRGWALLTANRGTLIGGTVLVMLAQAAIGFVPFIGAIVSLIVGGALMGGMYWLFIRAIRGESAGVSDAFAGFSRGFVQLMLAHIVTGLLVSLCLIPTGLSALPLIIKVVGGERSVPAIVTLLVLPGIVFVFTLPVIIYLSVSWAFTLPLIIDKGLGFWEAMSLSRKTLGKHWWTVFALFFVIGLVSSAGILLCGVGMLVTAPLAIAAAMYAYEDIFGTRPTATV
jgi:hypothetical protein